MLGNEKLLFDELYEKTKDCGRVQFVKLLMTKERENKQLKKQLEERTKMYQNAYDYSQKMEGKAIILETQQKEFIKYLEDEINKEKDDLEKLCELYNIPKENDIAYKFFYSYINKLEKILKKYKEIIGVSDENNIKTRN